MICVRYMDGSVFEVGIQMGGNFVYFTGIVMGVYLKLVYMHGYWVVKQVLNSGIPYSHWIGRTQTLP